MYDVLSELSTVTSSQTRVKLLRDYLPYFLFISQFGPFLFLEIAIPFFVFDNVYCMLFALSWQKPLPEFPHRPHTHPSRDLTVADL